MFLDMEIPGDKYYMAIQNEWIDKRKYYLGKDLQRDVSGLEVIDDFSDNRRK